MTQIGETLKIPVTREDANFDRACDTAYQIAIARFGIDQNGHSLYLKEWERSCCSITVTFIEYSMMGGMGGRNHDYVFEAKAEKHEDE